MSLNVPVKREVLYFDIWALCVCDMSVIHTQHFGFNPVHCLSWQQQHGCDGFSVILWSNYSCFYTGQQAANLAVVFAARSTNLDRPQYTGGLFWSANMTPRGVHFLPPPLLCKSKSSMSRQLREMDGGVNDMHCCATHSREF